MCARRRQRRSEQTSVPSGRGETRFRLSRAGTAAGGGGPMRPVRPAGASRGRPRPRKSESPAGVVAIPTGVRSCVVFEWPSCPINGRDALVCRRCGPLMVVLFPPFFLKERKCAKKWPCCEGGARHKRPGNKGGSKDKKVQRSVRRTRYRVPTTLLLGVRAVFLWGSRETVRSTPIDRRLARTVTRQHSLTASPATQKGRTNTRRLKERGRRRDRIVRHPVRRPSVCLLWIA